MPSASMSAACSRSSAAVRRCPMPCCWSWGTMSVMETGPRSARSRRVSNRSSESTVWLATTRSLVRYIGRSSRGVEVLSVEGAPRRHARATTRFELPTRPLFQCIGEAPRDPRWGHPTLLLPERHHHQLGAVPAADEDQRAVHQVAHVDGPALALLDPARLQGARDAAHDLGARVQRAGDALAEPLDRMVGDGHEHRYRSLR